MTKVSLSKKPGPRHLYLKRKQGAYRGHCQTRRQASQKRFSFRVKTDDTTKTDLCALHMKGAARCASRGLEEG